MPDVASAEHAAWLRQIAPKAQLSADSRSIAVGDVFFAYPGDAGDGRRYIADAIGRGAAAVVYDPAGFTWSAEWQVPCRAAERLQQAAGPIAADFYGHPDRSMLTVAVTGTNGKTSCAVWLGEILSRLMGQAASIGTLGVGMFNAGIAAPQRFTGYTTPDPVMLQRTLAQLRDKQIKAVAIEASSIGLQQGRMNGMHVDIALFTNLSRDHLDFHADMASYEAAKGILFDWPGLQHAVINLDDAAGLRLVQRLRERADHVGLTGYTITGTQVDGVPTLSASNLRSSTSGTGFTLTSPLGLKHLRTRLVGDFNVSNLLGIFGVLLARKTSLQAATSAVEALKPAPGRMEQYGGHEAPLVIVDYAHTPDAITKTLAALRPIAQQRQGSLWCVFGCGGDRDPGKRPEMGKAAAQADHVVVTSDNPRSESPAAIMQDILAGIPGSLRERDALQTIEDRATAILWAIKHAARGDVILIAGKGHENYQEIMKKKLPFSDADHVALALSSRATMKEPG